MATDLKQLVAEDLKPKVDSFGSLPSLLNGLQEELRILPDLFAEATNEIRKSWFKFTPGQRQMLVAHVAKVENFSLAIEESLRQNKPFLHPDLIKVYTKDLKRFSDSVERLRKMIGEKMATDISRSVALDMTPEDLAEHERALRELESDTSEVFTAEEFRQRFR